MSLFSFFPRPDINRGIQQYRASKEGVLIDVRTPEEFREGHIPGSVNVPLDRLESIPFPVGTTLYVYCHSGARSAQACGSLNMAGYNTVNIGGIGSYRGMLERAV